MVKSTIQTQKLADAFKLLLSQATFEHITVKQICTQAGVHRSTFYRHFDDKFQLLEFLCVAMLRQQNDGDNVIEQFFSMIEQNKKFFRNVTVNNSNAMTVFYLERLIANRMLEKISLQSNADPDEPIPSRMRAVFLTSQNQETVAHFFAGALLSVGISWIEHNFVEPKSVVVASYLRCIR